MQEQSEEISQYGIRGTEQLKKVYADAAPPVHTFRFVDDLPVVSRHGLIPGTVIDLTKPKGGAQ
ncbi:MAG: hypothetical protein ACYDCF_08245 [Burkholderiales bacterium]